MSEFDESRSLMRCLRCRGRLEKTGREPYRFACGACGQNYMVVMQLVPVDAGKVPLLESPVAERGQGSR